MRNELVPGEAQNRRHIVRLVATAAAAASLPLIFSSAAKAAGRHSGGTDPSPLCLLRGTHVRTVRGEVAVEDLIPGDMMVTEFSSVRPVVWVGRTTFTRAQGEAWSRNLAPVRIARSAIADNVPSRDVFVSPDHALFLDGYLIPAKLLVNGRNISQDVFEGETIDYFHVECDAHDVMYAEGLPVETLRVTTSYLDFDNGSERAAAQHMEPGESCAPVLGYWNTRQDAMALLRRATSICFDVRDPVQVAFDRIEARAHLAEDLLTA